MIIRRRQALLFTLMVGLGKIAIMTAIVGVNMKAGVIGTVILGRTSKSRLANAATYNATYGLGHGWPLAILDIITAL